MHEYASFYLKVGCFWHRHCTFETKASSDASDASDANKKSWLKLRPRKWWALRLSQVPSPRQAPWLKLQSITMGQIRRPKLETRMENTKIRMPKQEIRMENTKMGQIRRPKLETWMENTKIRRPKLETRIENTKMGQIRSPKLEMWMAMTWPKRCFLLPVVRIRKLIYWQRWSSA